MENGFMKKQIKLVSVLSTAAVLSLCASLVSFADTGWEQKDDSWFYYNEKGEQVTEDWVQQDGQWYWLDENGVMAAGRLVEIENNYYYLKEDGTMASEEWIGIPNEYAGDEDEPEKHWYYFQKNGKAYRRTDGASAGSIQAKTINGKKYAFDTEGRMLYGWVSEGERQTGDDAWVRSDYYFGEENDGVMRQGWARLYADPDDMEDAQPGSDFWEGNDYRWFYFNANGRKAKAEDKDCQFKTINGNRYAFDQYGRMIVSWYADPDEITLATNKTEAGAEGKGEGEYQGQADYSRKFMYFGPAEAGARYIKGWFRAMPSEYLMKSKHEDEEVYTYYADESGHICASEIKTIGGERYGFDNYGRVMSGLVCLKMEDETTSKKIEYNFSSDATVKSGRGPFGSEEEFDELVETYAEDFQNHLMRFYWFGGTDGAMVTGKQMVPLTKHGEKYEFMFETKGRYKGCGVFGEKDGKLYKAGKLIKPGDSQKYAIVKQTYETLPANATEEEKKEFAKRDLDGDGKIEGVLTKISVDRFISEVCNSGIVDEKKDETVWTVRYDPPETEYFLISSNGNIVKNKKRARNEDGYEFYVKNRKIWSITAEN